MILEVKLDMNIHEAAKHGKIDIVKYHLLQGVPVDEKDRKGNLDINKRNNVSNIHNI